MFICFSPLVRQFISCLELSLSKNYPKYQLRSLISIFNIAISIFDIAKKTQKLAMVFKDPAYHVLIQTKIATEECYSKSLLQKFYEVDFRKSQTKMQIQKC